MATVPVEDDSSSNTPPRFLSSPVTLQFVDIYYSIKLSSSTFATGGGSTFPSRFCGGENDDAVKEKTILNGVSGTVSPGEMLAVLGPSGSGKSTLLSILAGRNRARHGGAVLANGRQITTSSTARRRIGFVPQDDLLYPHLTVRETLLYSALLRLPRTLCRSEKIAAVEAVVAELGLENCADTVVGGAFVRGVSGGERKRVSIAQEMLVGPSVLVLDEPTSGLDSTAAYRVVAALAAAAARGRSVVAAVHQPSSRVYQMFDAVLLLVEGRCAYFGHRSNAVDYFVGVGFNPGCHVNPADFMLDLANGFAPADYEGDHDKSKVKQTLISSYNRLLDPKVKSAINGVLCSLQATRCEKSTAEERNRHDLARISWLSQFTILLQRSLKERRHESFSSLRIFQVISAAVLAGAMWWRSDVRNVHDRLGLLFFVAIFWGVFASSNAVFSFPRDRAILLSERAAGVYSLSPYFAAKTAGDLPMELTLPTLFLLVLYFMAGLRPEITAFLLTLIILLCYVLVAQGLGLALGAAIMDAKQASMVVTVTMLAFLLTGGFYVKNVPVCIDSMKYASFTYYAYRLLIDVQYRGTEMGPLVGVSGGANGVGRRTAMTEEVAGKEVGAAMSVMALALMFVGYRLLAYAALRRTKV